MKKVLFTITAILAIGCLVAFTLPADSTPTTTTKDETTITWYTWEQAIELNKKEPRKLFIDLYTDWCGWCKRMDASTFKDPAVVKHLNENYYPIKFDAEQKEDVLYNSHTFKFIDQGRRGVHELAYSLLEGQLSYPSYVYMDEQVRRITISKGFKEAPAMIKELEYITGESYIKKNQ
ncbi:MAG: hypothetical protein Sapg2KO_39050 [Saprospiraceae bacterium]